jgi:hypothetical protein
LSYKLSSSKCGKKILKKPSTKRLAKGKKEKKYLMPSTRSEQDIKTNSYRWILPALDLLYESPLLYQSNEVNMLALTIRKAIIVIISDLAKTANNPRT